MRRKALDLCLIVAALVGGFFVWKTGRERARLAVDYQRLIRATGDLPIGDPARLHVRALETGEPGHYAWRIYLPPNYRLVVRQGSGGSGSSFSAKSAEFIARIRFREDDGELNVYQHWLNTSSDGGFGDKELAGLVRGRWSEVRVEQLGVNGLATLGPGEPAVLLRLTLPESIQEEARRKLSAEAQKSFVPVLFEVGLGPEPPKPLPPPPPGS